MSSDGDEQGGEEEQVWDDWEDDGPGEEYQCLFCGSRGESIDACFRHMASEHAFDFQQVRKGAGLEFYDCLKMINYIRSEVAAGRPPSAADFAKVRRRIPSYPRPGNHVGVGHDERSSSCRAPRGSQPCVTTSFLSP